VKCEGCMRRSAVRVNTHGAHQLALTVAHGTGSHAIGVLALSLKRGGRRGASVKLAALLGAPMLMPRVRWRELGGAFGGR